MVNAPQNALEALNQVYPFRLMPDEDKAALAQQAGMVEFGEKERIYNQQDEGEALFMVLEGEVQLAQGSGEEDESSEPMGVLRSGNLFGLEVLGSPTTRLTSATAVGRVRLLRIEAETLLDVMQEVPYLYRPLRLMWDSFSLSLKVHLPWREADELVIYMARRHPIFLWVKLLPALFIFAVSTIMLTYLALVNLPGTTLIGLIAGLFALLSGLWGIWVWVDWSNDYAIITSRRVVFQERVVMLYDSRQEAPLQTVLANTTNTSQVGRILGYGDVVLKTYTGTIILPAVSQPTVVSIILQDHRGFMQVVQRHQDLRDVRSMVKNRIFQAPPPAPSQPAVAASKPPDEEEEEEEVAQTSAAQRLANLLQMRSEEGGIITYRQHWLILLRQVFLPLVLILAVLVLLALGAFNVLTVISVQAMAALGLLISLGLMFWLWYQYEDWANDKYILTSDQLVDVYKKPLGEEEKRSAPLKNIQSVEFEKLGLIRLILNYGTVFIRIGDAQFTFDNVYYPSDVQREIFRRMEALTFREKKKEIDAVRDGILDVLEAYDQLRKENNTHGD